MRLKHWRSSWRRPMPNWRLRASAGLRYETNKNVGKKPTHRSLGLMVYKNWWCDVVRRNVIMAKGILPVNHGNESNGKELSFCSYKMSAWIPREVVSAFQQHKNIRHSLSQLLVPLESTRSTIPSTRISHGLWHHAHILYKWHWIFDVLDRATCLCNHCHAILFCS